MAGNKNVDIQLPSHSSFGFLRVVGENLMPMHYTNPKLANLYDSCFRKAHIVLIVVPRYHMHIGCQGAQFIVLFPANIPSTNHMLHFVRSEHSAKESERQLTVSVCKNHQSRGVVARRHLLSTYRLKFSGMTFALPGMWRSPRTSTSSPKLPIVCFAMCLLSVGTG
jgi:hypothetical protein